VYSEGTLIPHLIAVLTRTSSDRDTSNTVVRCLREEFPTIDAVCRQLERQVDPNETDPVVAFAEIFLSKATKEFLHGRSADTLAHKTLGSWWFLQDSHPDRGDVEVFNPEVDKEGWYAPVMVLRTSISERPFIVDSLREFLHDEDLSIEYLIYPVMHVERNGDGDIISLRPSKDGESKESFVYCEVSRIMDAGARESLRREASRRLQDVIRVTDDFHPMIDALNGTVVELAECVGALPDLGEELEEVQAFLRWIRDGAFVFLGYREYDIVELDGGPAIVVQPGSGLGVLRNEAESQFAEPVLVSEADPSTDPNIRTGLVSGGHARGETSHPREFWCRRGRACRSLPVHGRQHRLVDGTLPQHRGLAEFGGCLCPGPLRFRLDEFRLGAMNA
jgi:glutamate dehydrogenase